MKIALIPTLLCSCALITAHAEDAKPGLIAEVYDMGAAVEDFPTLAADKKPTVRKIDATIAVDSTDDKWPGTELTDHFFIRWTGSVKIAKDGKYTFSTESDDGSRVFIDGKQVVDNGGQHAMEEKSGEVELKAGDHEIKVEFFENEGGAGCKLSWQGEGIDKQIVPATALSHKADATLDK